MSMAESWALRDAFRRYGRIYQAGCQRRNAGNLELAVGLVNSGKLGKLQTVVADVGPLAKLAAAPQPRLAARRAGAA